MGRYQFIVVAVFALLPGCVNPFVAGFSGQPGLARPNDARVQSFGAHDRDERAMAHLDHAFEEAETDRRLLGTSSIVSSSILRDRTAIDAGRELGADLVLYKYRYFDTTIENHSSTSCQTETQHYDIHDYDTHQQCSKRTWEVTRHWYQYDVYFFANEAETAAENKLKMSDD